MMKKIVLAIALVAVFGTFASAAILGSRHDLSTGSPLITNDTNSEQTCVFCHTPHGAIAATKPLWNHDANQGALNFIPYNAPGDPTTSSTMQSTTAVFAANTSAVSALCLGCHDGVSAVNALANAPGSGLGPDPTFNSTGAEIVAAGTALNPANGKTMGGGGILYNEHPINMVPADPAMAPIVGLPLNPTQGGLPLYGATGTVQCGSCHNPHDTTNPAFLRESMADSLLCTLCHIDK